jgi:pyruvate dehydrogenase E2 component (dihydrolipoamide acetyltransferase)
MAAEVTIPKLGLTMTEAKVVHWLKRDGQQVEQGEPLVVVMTAKVTHEIEAPAAGVLHTIARPQETRKVSDVIGLILQPGEAVPQIGLRGSLASGSEPPEALQVPAAKGQPRERSPLREVRSSPAARRLARELGIDIALVSGTGRDGRIVEEDVQRYADAASNDERAVVPEQDVGQVQATPLARRMAQLEGLDLGQVQGTGPEGRIVEEDVLRVLEGGTVPAAARPQVLPFTAMRQAIAEGMMHSLHSTAQLTLTAKADVTALVELREVLRQRWSARISYTDLIVKAVAIALREHPLLNSTLTEEGIVLYSRIDIGVAVALERGACPERRLSSVGVEGLIVPVVRDADKRSVIEIHGAIEDLAERARKGALSVDEVTGGTFTLTNLGMYGVETFTPIINPPEAAILGVGRIAEELVLRNAQVIARSKMMLSLTIDHRIVDGAPGAAFLRTVAQLLEHPALIFAEGPVGSADLESNAKGEE